MDCSVKPYEGNKDYIFVSYCRKDKKHVYPIIEQMARKGYRIWYDSGIHDDEEGFEKIIKSHSGCTVVVSFVTNNAILDYNCRKEIVMAFEDNKKILPVVLEKVELTGGWWTVKFNQAIHGYKMPYEKMLEQLCNTKILNTCLGEPQHNITISKPSDYGDTNCIVEEGILSNDEMALQHSSTVENVSSMNSDKQVADSTEVIAETEEKEDKMVDFAKLLDELKKK